MSESHEVSSLRRFPHLLGNVVAMGLFGWRLWRALGGAAVWGLYVTGGAAAQLVVALSASGVGLGARCALVCRAVT
jgi:membrane associated rhomboid family serine protease